MRNTSSVQTTEVIYVAHPSGFSQNGANPPCLKDLRAFVAECEGLDDDLHVYIDNGQLNEAGRRNVTFRVTHKQPISETP